MAVKTFTDGAELAAHLGEQLASDFLSGKIGPAGMAKEFLTDLALIKACDAGEPVVIWDAP